MPQPVNNVKGSQWDSCDQCGRLFPMGMLVKQKGLLVCTTTNCFDNLTVEQRPWVILNVLGAGVEQEGADTRVVDRGFWEGYDEIQR